MKNARPLICHFLGGTNRNRNLLSVITCEGTYKAIGEKMKIKKNSQQ